MQIGGLGYVKSMATSQNAQGTKGKESFMSVLNGLQTQPKEEQKKDSNSLSALDITNLLSFLGTVNIQDIEGGSKIKDQLMSNSDTDMLQIIKQYLGISDEKWNSLLESLSRGIGSSLPQEKKDEKNPQDLLAAMLAGLLSLPQDKLMKLPADDLKGFLKAAKLSDLMAANKDSAKSLDSLGSLLEKVKETLSNLAANQKPANRNEFLQNVFTRLVSDLNQKTEEKDKKVFPSQEIKTDSHDFKLNISGETINSQSTGKSIQPLLMLQSNGRPINTNELIRQFESILSKAQLSGTGGEQKLLVNLHPDNLGSLRIELIQRDGTITAKILTSTGAAKDALESHMNGLKQAFAAQNIQVERLEISQQLSQPDRFLGREQQGQPQGQRQNTQENNKKSEEDDGDFNFSLEEALVNMEV
ncbi:flagellar hook-length control protein FliK [Neobacillus terrae]|uniref:flagellar hook-length control protein FliK n=1 Tax=Neobacillus terrae TaxID=3034837 RepID=UPI001407D39D|nr:flagellar hook-length control protein FliK [Neobacillus terrae]NHM29797.1 flagellar hook-length control protein FliK [Neobacillus terrae]